MYDKDLKSISYTAGFFMLISFAIGGLILAAQLNATIWHWMTGADMESMQNGLANPSYSTAYKVIQTVTAIVGFFIPTIVTAMLLHRRPLRLVGFRGGIGMNQIGLTILILGLSLLVASALSYVTNLIPLSHSLKVQFDKMESDYNSQVSAILTLRSGTDYLVALMVMALVPAVCEETIFRGGLQNFLARSTRHPWMAIIFASLIFSLAHFSYYGFLSRFFLGVVLGLLYQYSGRIWFSILAHFLYNGTAITLLYFEQRQHKPTGQVVADTPALLWGFVALPVVIMLIRTFRSAFINRRIE